MSLPHNSTEMCKGCKVVRCNTPAFYYKKYIACKNYIEFICPCSLCLVKVMCNSYCNKYYKYEDRYKKGVTNMESGTQLKLPNVNTL
jgi:hypothetical protein